MPSLLIYNPTNLHKMFNVSPDGCPFVLGSGGGGVHTGVDSVERDILPVGWNLLGVQYKLIT